MLLAVVEMTERGGCVLLPLTPRTLVVSDSWAAALELLTEGKRWACNTLAWRAGLVSAGWDSPGMWDTNREPWAVEGAAELPCWLPFNPSCCRVLSNHYC